MLKDASSTAIYGSRAANGVVLITTKRAKAGKVTVVYNGFYAVQKSTNNPEHMEVGDYMRMQNIAYTNVGSAPKYTEQQIQDYVNAIDRYKYPLPYTMAEVVLRPAPQVNHSLSVSGGNENFKARLSLRYQDQGGIIPNSESQLSEVRVNTDFAVSPKIKIGTDVNYRYVNALAPSEEFRVFERLKHGSVWTVPKYPDGTYGISAQGQNALMYAEIHGKARNANDFIIGNIKGDWEIVKGLTFTMQLAARMNMETGKAFFNSYTINDYYDPTIVRRTMPVNALTETRNITRELTLNNLLHYTTTLGGNSLNVLAGYSEIDNRGNNLSAYRQGFYNNDIQSIGQGTDDNTKNNGGNEYQWGLRSFFGRLNYAYRDRYLFEANGRFDGSSRFTGPNRYSFFPSFSTGWRISEERFWDPFSNTVNEFKLRGSWGKTGNQAVALYSYFPTLDLVNYSFNGLPVQGFLQQQMTKEDITWETTIQSNAGLEAQFLNNRFSFSADYYKKRTDGILLVLPVPGTLGLLPSPQNAGTVDNKGWEFTAGSRNNFGAFGLDANLNFSVNNNKVVNLAGTGPYLTGSITETRIIYQLYPSCEKLFSYAAENNPEVILDKQYIKNNYKNDVFRLMGPWSQLNSSSTFVPTKKLADAYLMSNGMAIADPGSGYNPQQPYSNRDPRLRYTIFTPGDQLPDGKIYNSRPGSGTADAVDFSWFSTNTGFNVKKYINKEDLAEPANSGINLILLRYADVLLMYAEAKIEANQIDASVLDALNQVRQRPDVNMPPITGLSSQAEFRRLVRQERLVELAFEGLRYFDIRRWKIAQDVMAGKVYGLTYADKGTMKTVEVPAFDISFNKNRDFLWPIPQKERELNPQFTQNPNW